MILFVLSLEYIIPKYFLQKYKLFLNNFILWRKKLAAAHFQTFV